MNGKNHDTVCLVCNQRTIKGITIFSSLICQHCEKDITEINLSNQQYDNILNQLKKIEIYK